MIETLSVHTKGTSISQLEWQIQLRFESWYPFIIYNTAFEIKGAPAEVEDELEDEYTDTKIKRAYLLGQTHLFD